MLSTYTAKYTKIPSGYMGQIVEWSEVVTEGQDIEECRAMLKDALQEMVIAYSQQNKEIPIGNFFMEQIPVERKHFTTQLKRFSANTFVIG